MKSKTIIISSPDSDNSRGILTITEDTDRIRCKLRLYHTPPLSADCHLGIYHNDQVYTANLINRHSYYESSLTGDFDMSLDFYAAIIDTSHNNAVILAGGTYTGYYFNDHSPFTQAKASQSDNYDIDTATIPPDTDTCSDCDQCTHCVYKEYFYAHAQDTAPASPSDPSPTSTEHESTSPEPYSILSSLIPQFEHIFATNEPNNELSSLVKNSRFVTIKDESEYSIGAIFYDEQIAYICYAVRCRYNTPAPEELGQHYQWLPLDPTDPLSDGYYLVYQDAHDLKIVEV